MGFLWGVRSSLEELLYKPNLETDEFNWDKVLYNIRYHDPSFYDNKFPSEITQIPAYHQIIHLIVEKNEDNSPLKKMTVRNNIIKYKDNEDVSSR